MQIIIHFWPINRPFRCGVLIRHILAYSLRWSQIDLFFGGVILQAYRKHCQLSRRKKRLRLYNRHIAAIVLFGFLVVYLLV